MSRKVALIIGIDTYQYFPKLSGCATDSEEMGKLLKRHSDLRTNYDCRILADRMEDGQPITGNKLREACFKLFTNINREDVLLYFSGHGTITHFGGYLCAYDSKEGNWGIPMQEIMDMVNNSNARDVVIILDCCHSGNFANPSFINSGVGRDPIAALRQDTTVIAASRDIQVAMETNGRGIFTSAVVDALNGGAADHMGFVTAPSIYAYVERRFNAFSQRPVYKSHTTGVTIIRECAPLIERYKLYELIKHFPTIDFKYRLDPEFEPQDEHGNYHQPVNQEKLDISNLFKDYRDAGLLKGSNPGEQFFWIAKRGNTVELTQRGREYWWLVKNEKL